MAGRALISVFDKTGVVEFSQGLVELGWELISTGGTYTALQQAGVPVQEVAKVAGFPEILDGRVKTLQPQIHAGILAMRDHPGHMEQLQEHGIGTIDMVVVNLYPFQTTVAAPTVTFAEAIEKIDIGGPTMVRAAAKNWQHVAVVVTPGRYADILAELRQDGDLSRQTRFNLMVAAFEHTSLYDTAVYTWMEGRGRELALGGAAGNAPAPATQLPSQLNIRLSKVQDLRYGENPHQGAAFYRDDIRVQGGAIVSARQLHGKELSFNNINDAHAALELVKEFDRPAAVAVKHTNPCGVALANTLAEAYRLTYAADPVSIFGGIVALNRPCDEETAAEIKKIFVEIVLAPEFTPGALAILTKKKDLRLLAAGTLGAPGPAGFDVKRVHGGYLVQEWDAPMEDKNTWRPVTSRVPTPAELADLAFAWKVCKHVKSNAIVVAQNAVTLGVGAGQMNRIDAARHALAHAQAHADGAASGAVLASDAFFPFPDVVEAAAAAGISAIAQPGGSIRDEDSIRRADELGLAMVFTGVRHFRH